jgi:hypothetical protein
MCGNGTADFHLWERPVFIVERKSEAIHKQSAQHRPKLINRKNLPLGRPVRICRSVDPLDGARAIIDGVSARVSEAPLEEWFCPWELVPRFEAIAVARLCRRNSAAGVTTLLQFRSTAKIPERKSTLQMWHSRAAQADFRSFSWDQNGNS